MGSPHAIRCHARAGGSITLLARVDNLAAQPITRASILGITYSIHLLDPDDANKRTPVEGHVDVAIDKNAVVFDELQHDAIWTKDEIGYNLKFTVDRSVHEAFGLSDREYLVMFEIVPEAEQIILVPFVIRTVKDAS